MRFFRRGGFDPVKDASQRASGGTPVADDGLWLAPAKPALRILDRIEAVSLIIAAMRSMKARCDVWQWKR
jgi:hypothetical protein